MHFDYSQMLEAEGIKVTFVQAGKYKTEGNSYEPLPDDARDFLQQSVDESYTTFVKAVAKYRDVSVKDVRAKFGEGRCLGAPAALEAGMVDKIGTLRDVLGKLTGSQSTGAKAAADVLRRRQAWRKIQAQAFRA
jgi:ClpP class serine protease